MKRHLIIPGSTVLVLLGFAVFFYSCRKNNNEGLSKMSFVTDAKNWFVDSVVKLEKAKLALGDNNAPTVPGTKLFPVMQKLDTLLE